MAGDYHPIDHRDISIVEAIQELVPPNRLDEVKDQDFFSLTESNVRCSAKLLADIIICNSRARNMFNEAKEIIPELVMAREALKGKEIELLESKALYKDVLTSSETYKKALGERIEHY